MKYKNSEKYQTPDLMKKIMGPNPIKLEEELLVEGEWAFDWTYHYKSNANVYRMLKDFECNDVTYYLTKVEISPISVRIEAFCKPQDRNQTRPGDLIQKITYQDGTSVEIPGDSSGGVRDGMYVDSFVDVGMTGEITLRGRVLPIGGLREKSIAAHRSGLKKILIPIENVKDIEDIPATVLEQLQIVPVATVDEVLKIALID